MAVATSTGVGTSSTSVAQTAPSAAPRYPSIPLPVRLLFDYFNYWGRWRSWAFWCVVVFQLLYLGILLIFFTLLLFYVGIHAVGDSWHADSIAYRTRLSSGSWWGTLLSRLLLEMCKRLVCMMVPYSHTGYFSHYVVYRVTKLFPYIVLLCRIRSSQAVCQGASLCFVCDPCSHCSRSLSWEQEEPWASTAFQAQGIILCTCFTS
jgi:hypothetical protein